MQEEYVEYETVVDILIAHGFSQFSTPHGEMSGWETVNKMWMPYTPEKIVTQLTPNQRMQRRAWGGMAAKLSLTTGVVYLKNNNKWLDFNMYLKKDE
jgi:hypothetical protein